MIKSCNNVSTIIIITLSVFSKFILSELMPKYSIKSSRQENKLKLGGVGSHLVLLALYFKYYYWVTIKEKQRSTHIASFNLF